MTAVSNKCYHEQDRYKEIDATHLNGVDVVAEAGRVDQVWPSPAVIGVDVDDRAGREVDDLLFYVRRGRFSVNLRRLQDSRFVSEAVRWR